MTDRVKGFTVVLEDDVRVDDVESLMNAVRHLRGVLSVEAVITDVDDFLNRERVRKELIHELSQVLMPSWAKQTKRDTR